MYWYQMTVKPKLVPKMVIVDGVEMVRFVPQYWLCALLTKSLMKNKKKFRCYECGRDDFKSDKGVAQHDRKAHPYIPSPPPKKIVEVENGSVEPHTLLGGKKVQLGDTIWFGKKAIVTKITYTEGSDDVSVEARIINTGIADRSYRSPHH